MPEEAVGPVDLEGHLGYEDEVGLVDGEHRVDRDEARLPAHQLDEADAVHRRVGLDVGCRHRLGGAGDGRLEAEAAVDVAEVVVDRLRDPDDGDLEVAPLDLLGDRDRALLRAVAADREQHVEVEPLDGVHDVGDPVAAAARGAEEGAADLVHLVDGLGVQRLDADVELGEEAAVAVADARDSAHAVAEPEAAHDGADDVVDAGAEPAAGDDARVDVARGEEYLLARSGLLEETAAVEACLLPFARVDVVADELVVGHVIGEGIAHLRGEDDRREYPALAEDGHAEIYFFGHRG